MVHLHLAIETNLVDKSQIIYALFSYLKDDFIARADIVRDKKKKGDEEG